MSRGSIFEDGAPRAIYLAGMHACQDGGSVILGAGVMPPDGSPPDVRPEAFSIQIWLVNDNFEMTLLDPEQSPWRTHPYLGRMLTRTEVLGSPRKEFFFSIADCVVNRNPTVFAFFKMLERR